MHLSDRIQNVSPSASMVMTQAARDLRAEGRDVISLSVGEPDFEVPDHILEAATRAMTDGHTGYTASDGIAELKHAIIDKFARDNDLTFEASQINVSPGGKAVLWNVLAVTTGPGDEVIVPTPCWVSYPDMVKLTGATPILLPGEADFKITSESLEAVITPHTRWLMLNSPGNPTGAVYSEQELSQLADVLRRHPQVMVLSDDIYERLVFGQAKFATMASVAPDLADRCVTMNGASKTYAMTGFRIGYASGPTWLIDGMRKFMGQTTSCPAAPSQWAAVAALNGPHDFLDEWRAKYRARARVMVEAMNQAGLTCTLPDGAFYVFANCETVMKRKGFATDTDFALALLQETGVATVQGSAYQSPGHLRLSYAASIEQVKEACSRISAFCET